MGNCQPTHNKAYIKSFLMCKESRPPTQGKPGRLYNGVAEVFLLYRY
jgi:hypothetical protein